MVSKWQTDEELKFFNEIADILRERLGDRLPERCIEVVGPIPYTGMNRHHVQVLFQWDLEEGGNAETGPQIWTIAHALAELWREDGGSWRVDIHNCNPHPECTCSEEERETGFPGCGFCQEEEARAGGDLGDWSPEISTRLNTRGYDDLPAQVAVEFFRFFQLLEIREPGSRRS